MPFCPSCIWMHLTAEVILPISTVIGGDCLFLCRQKDVGRCVHKRGNVLMYTFSFIALVVSISGTGKHYGLIDTGGRQLSLWRRHQVQVSTPTSGVSEHEVLAARVSRRECSHRIGQPRQELVHIVCRPLCRPAGRLISGQADQTPPPGRDSGPRRGLHLRTGEIG